MNQRQFQRFVHLLVQEELKRQLPGVVASVLAEGFLKRVVQEAVGSSQAPKPSRRSRAGSSLSLAEVMGLARLEGHDEQEDSPAPMENTDEGIYQETPLKHDDHLDQYEEARQRLSEQGMGELFEGTAPIPSGNANGAPEVSERAVLALADPGRMSELLGDVDERAVQRSPMPVTSDMKMQELQRRRQLLEVRSDGSRPVPSSPKPLPVAPRPSVLERFELERPVTPSGIELPPMVPVTFDDA